MSSMARVSYRFHGCQSSTAIFPVHQSVVIFGCHLCPHLPASKQNHLQEMGLNHSLSSPDLSIFGRKILQLPACEAFLGWGITKLRERGESLLLLGAHVCKRRSYLCLNEMPQLRVLHYRHAKQFIMISKSRTVLTPLTSLANIALTFSILRNRIQSTVCFSE